MSNEIKLDEKDQTRGVAPRRKRLPLPGLAAISLYLLLLSGVIVVGVVSGHYYPPFFLVFAAGFITAAAGLLLLLRWAWAMALGAVFLLVVYDFWIFSIQREPPALVQGLLNLVFFLYLVRTEVRAKLR
jgi:glycerol-3-phosphate acyltransferase PlsY